MTSPISSGGGPRRLELSRDTPFQKEADGGKPLELAMVTALFVKLQDAGYIRKGALMASKVPEAPGLKSTTYEARLRELVKDTDGNGRFDVDLEALAASKMLEKAPTAEALEGVLAGRYVGGFTDAFLRKQDPRSKFLDDAAISPLGQQVNAYASLLVLTNEQDRASAAFIAGVPARAASPAGAKAVLDEALNGATVLTNKGDLGRARALLEGVGGALIAAGKLDEAAKAFAPLTRAPHATVRRQAVQDIVDALKAKGPFDELTEAAELDSTNGNVLLVKPSQFVSTVGEIAGARLEQLAMHQRMAAALGRSVDPRNPDDARAYFDTFAKGRPTAEVAREYQGYLEAFFKHSGIGVEWTKAIGQDERSGRLGELFDGQPADDASRAIIDCEGYSYLTDHVLGGVRDEAGRPRFEVLYATRPGHVITGVVDASSKQAFTVNNDSVSAPAPLKQPHDVRRLIARELCGKEPNLINIGRTQSASQPQSDLEGHPPPPKVGSLVWNGQDITGTINEDIQRVFQEAARRQPVTYDGLARDIEKLRVQQQRR